MGKKKKRKLTCAEKAEKRRRRKEYMTIFINGKQKRVKRAPMIDGLDLEEFIRRNADPVFLQQSEMWEYMGTHEEECPAHDREPDSAGHDFDEDLPF